MSEIEYIALGAKDDKSAEEAKADAQRIAFAPIVFQAAKALRDLGILRLLFESRGGGLTASEVSLQSGITLYGVKVLLEAGMGAQLVHVEENKYYLSKTGYFILKDRLTTVNMNFVSDVCYDGMTSLADSIEQGKPVGLEHFGPWPTIYEGLSQLPEKVKKSWFDFDHFYSDVAFPKVLAQVFTHAPRALVDVGGNTGRWASKCLNYNDDVHVTILDLPGQIEEAREKLAAEGFEGRFSTIEANFLDDEGLFPSNADVIWMSQFLDCFSEGEIIRILSQAKLGMHAKSSLYILETFWDRQRFEAAAFSLVNTSLYFSCFANGNSKMYHSDDMKRCAEAAGLILKQQIDGIGIGHTLLEYSVAI
jgi:hypothetical protein